MSQSRRQFVAEALATGIVMAEQKDNLKIATKLKIVQVGDAVLRSRARQLSVEEVRSKNI